MAVFEKRSKYWIEYRYKGRRVRECIGASKKLAQSVYAKRLVEIAEGRYLEKVKDIAPIKFKSFATEYLENHAKPNKKSWLKCDVVALNHLLPRFGELDLSEITPFMIEQYKTEKVKELSPSSVNRHLNCMRSMYSRAIAWGRVKDNPVAKVKFLKEPNHRLRYLEVQEINALLQHCNELLQQVVIFAIQTGMRKNEIRYLRWQDIDFRNCTALLLDTKNGSQRNVSLNSTALQVLMRVRRTNSPYVFSSPDEDSTKPYDFRTAFETALRKAGIKDFRFHDLRHTFASQLAMSGGVDLYTIQKLLGHRDSKMTQRYAHLSASHKSRAVNLLNHLTMSYLPTPTQVSNTPAAIESVSVVA